MRRCQLKISKACTGTENLMVHQDKCKNCEQMERRRKYKRDGKGQDMDTAQYAQVAWVQEMLRPWNQLVRGQNA